MNKTLFKTIWLSLVLALTLMLATPTLPVMGSNITQTTYVAVIRITNVGTAAYNVSVPLTLNTSQFISSYYFASNLSNTAMIDNHGNDTAYNPAVVANTTWMIFVPEIAANSVIDYRLYLGGGIDAGGRLALIPAATTGLTTTDDAVLELGNNFSIVQTGFIDTSFAAGKNLTNKVGAIVVNVTAAGNVTLTAGGTNVTASNISTGVHTVEVFNTGADIGIRLDYTAVRLNVSDVNQNGVVNQVDRDLVDYYILNVRIPGDPDYLTYLRADLNLDGNLTIGDSTRVAANFTRLKYDLNCDGVEDQEDITKLQTYLSTALPASLWVAADFSGDSAVDASDLPYLQANIYSTLTVSATVANTANDWAFAQNDVWRYLESQTITINGTLKQSIVWQNEAFWLDTSGWTSHAQPYFRTTSTNADVSAVIISLDADHQAILTDWDVNAYTGNISIPGQPGGAGGMYEATNPTFPGHGIVDDLADGGDVPRGLLWFLLPTIGVIGLSLMIHDKTKSLVAQAGVILLCVLLISVIHIWSWWVIIPMAIQMGACALSGKIYSY